MTSEAVSLPGKGGPCKPKKIFVLYITYTTLRSHRAILSVDHADRSTSYASSESSECYRLQLMVTTHVADGIGPLLAVLELDHTRAIYPSFPKRQSARNAARCFSAAQVHSRAVHSSVHTGLLKLLCIRVGDDPTDSVHIVFD